MGGEAFEDVGTGQTAEEAFRNAVEAAAYEYGHGGYTGSIAEKDSFILFDLVEAGMTPREFKGLYRAVEKARGKTASLEEDYSEEELALALRVYAVADDKFGPAAAVELPVTDKRAKTALAGKPDGEKAFLFWGWASA